MLSFKYFFKESGSYHHTIWISPKGRIHELDKLTHGDWIAENWNELFDEPFDKSRVFDKPLEEGWISVRNHTGSFGTFEIVITGNRRSVKRNSRLLRDIIYEGFEKAQKNSKDLIVDISYTLDDRKTYVLPEDMDELEKAL